MKITDKYIVMLNGKQKRLWADDNGNISIKCMVKNTDGSTNAV